MDFKPSQFFSILKLRLVSGSLVFSLVWSPLDMTLPVFVSFVAIWYYKAFHVHLVLLFVLFKATPVAYRSSQGRHQIGATAAGLCYSHSNTRSRCICDLCCSLRQGRILNPLSEARDPTCILMDTSQILNPLSHKGDSHCLNNLKNPYIPRINPLWDVGLFMWVLNSVCSFEFRTHVSI